MRSTFLDMLIAILPRSNTVIKLLAVRTPILGRIIHEREQMRIALHAISSENNRLSEELSLAASERDHLKQLLESQKYGYCHCCRQNTVFRIEGEWLRDEYLCANCFSIPRQRHIQYILDTCFEG